MTRRAHPLGGFCGSVDPIMKYRYEYRRNGVTLRTQWSDRETARERMAERIGRFHEPGRVSSDGDSRFDGSHPGCARNGGLLSVEVAL